MSEFIEPFTASVTVEESAFSANGTLVTATASASASSTVSYEEAYQIALATATAIAQENANRDAESLTFYASANADALVYANNGEKVSATASATASSRLNYENAYEIALSTAQSVALSTAQTDANIINQAFPGIITLENLSSSNNAFNINDNSNFYYIKSSKGNSINMTPTFFAIGFSGVQAMAFDSIGNLYIGGTFTSFTGNNNSLIQNEISTIFNRVAMWNGSVWTPLGNGVNGTVNSIVIDSNDNVYIGGSFTALGDSTATVANRVAKWVPSTSSWSVLGTAASNGVSSSISALALDSSGNLYVGGSFTKLGDNTTSANRVAKWTPNNSSWSVLGTGINNGVANNTVNALALDSSNNLYVGGSFTSLNISGGTSAVNYIAKWTGSWSKLGEGLATGNETTSVNALAVDSSDNLYVGGSFTSLNISGGETTIVNRIAKWTTSWSVLGTSTNNGVNNTVNALAFDSSENLYVGGDFSICYNTTFLNANRIVKWNINGSSSFWSTVGQQTSKTINGVSSTVNDIAINKTNNKLYINVDGTLVTLFTDYINLFYNNKLVYQSYSNNSIISIYTYNKNGIKVCSVLDQSNTFKF